MNTLLNGLGEVIRKLLDSDRETGGQPVLPGAIRPQLLKGLEATLVNWDALHAHIRELQKHLGKQFRHNHRLPEEQAEAVVTRGLDALDDAALSSLALNPVALHALYDEIDERMPEAWLEAMERDGRALLQEHGRGVPPAAQLTGEVAPQGQRAGAETERAPGTGLGERVLRELLAYLKEPGEPPPPTNVEWECLLALPASAARQGLPPHEVRNRLARQPSLAAISNTLQAAAEKGYLIGEQRERGATEAGPGVRTRGVRSGGTSGGPETVYRLVPKKMAAALCHGLLSGAVPPSADVRTALLGLAEGLGVPPALLVQLREG